jgi:hypothetical protein
MRRRIPLLCPTILIAGSIFAYAQPQDPPPPPQTPPASGTVPKTKMKAMNLTGTVKAYEPGKSIEVDAKNGPHSYELTATDMTVTVGADVKVGSKVKVTEKPDTTGKKTVMIEASGGTH